jgi:lipoyl(octanoyl) transferase
VRRQIDVVSFLEVGRVSFDAALSFQKDAEARAKAGGRETLFLLEHEDVITIGRNADRRDLLVSEEHLSKLGVALRQTDRGGKLMAYPVLNLAPDRMDVRRYVRDLEEVLILTAADFGVPAARSDLKERWSSIWVGDEKLAAIGVHLSRWVTTHGVALNVTTDLARFSLIVPCGIADAGVTSLERHQRHQTHLGASTAPTLQEVAMTLRTHFAAVFDRELVERPAPTTGAVTEAAELIGGAS